MKQLNRFETTKLFYDEYPYKLVLHNSLSYLFRSKNLSFAKDNLDLLQQQLDEGEPLNLGSYYRRNPVEAETFFEAKNLYIEFSKQDDYKLRISNPHMQIYSHDRDWLLLVSSKIKSAYEFWEPNKSYISSLAKNTILVDKPTEFEYKVTLGNRCDSNLAEWIKSNPDKIKAGDICLNTIEDNGYTTGLYFYVKNDKILQLLNLFVSKLSRIDKLVYKSNIDK